MLRLVLLAAAAAFAASPALADPWINYDGYRAYPEFTYPVPYGYPVAAYTDYDLDAPVGYAPAHVRIYGVTQAPPYYNVPPYAVYAPY
jgi:hypothetical protein